MGPRDRPSPCTLAPGRIGAGGVAFVALAAVAPVAALATVVPGAFTQGILVVPLVFATLGVVLLLFAVGYVATAGRAPHAGALYSCIARGLGRPVGAGAGWLALASYQAIQFGLYGLAGAAAAPQLGQWFGADIPWWAVAAGCWLLVALLGAVRVELVGGLLAALVLAEVAVLAGFGAADLLDPAGHRITLDPLDPTPLAGIDRPALGLLLVVAALAFVGFETTAAYGEEARGPRRALARSTYFVVALTTLVYAAGSWATSVAAGPGRIAAVAADRGPELIFDLAAERLAPWAVTLGLVLLLTGLLAALISLHQTLARYLFAFGREHLLPAGLGRTARRTSAPRAASLTQSANAAVAIGACAALHFDPTRWLAARLAVAGGLGVLVLLLATSLSALLYLNRAPNGENAWRRFVAPALATVALGAIAYLAWVNLPALLGVRSGDPQVLIVPGAIAAMVLLGVLQALTLRGARPVVYAGVGLGGTAVVVAPRVPQPRMPGAHRPERVDR